MSENETNKSYEHIEEILKNDKRLKNETGELRTNLLHELVNNYDTKLFELLLSDEKIKNTFFIPVKDTFVFKHRAFKDFIDYNTSNNSYSKYLGKQIGLYVDDVPLADRGEVVLNFPFKDCVLEGGQRTEDGTDTYFEYDEKTKDFEKKQSKRREIFYNEILARDEIDQLFAPKAFCNAKKYDKDGEQQFTKFDRNADGTITDNLIIKGNNLLALHSLYQQFAGKVKLIYIDPPYNTGNDSFAYNNSFNHSTWLTFMKNRLEIAKKLLKKDGVIFISCDDNEYTYLKNICDEIFGFERFENIFHFKVRHENRILRQDIRYQKVIEQALCYSMKDYSPNRIFNNDKNPDDNYQFEIKVKSNVQPKLEKIAGYTIEIYERKDYELIKTENGNLKEYNIRGSLITQKGSASEFYELNLRERKEIDGLGALYKVIKMGERGDGLGYRYIRQPFDTGANGFYYQGKPLNTIEDKGNPYPNYYDFEKEFNNVADEGGIKFKNGKKPEKFLKKIFEIANLNKGDILLDFHLGSGSSASTAHKLNIQYLGIEQLDYGENDSVIRLKNVINGDDTGISPYEDVNWQGGGEFVYLEMAQKNEQARKLINECESYDDLMTVFKELCKRHFLNYNFRINDFSNKTSKDDRFKALPPERQKEIFVQMLDLNQMWVNASEMNDKRFGLSEEDKKVTNDFYGE